MKFRFNKINEASDRKFRPGIQSRKEYKINTDPLNKSMKTRLEDKQLEEYKQKHNYLDQKNAELYQYCKNTLKYIEDLNYNNNGISFKIFDLLRGPGERIFKIIKNTISTFDFTLSGAKVYENTMVLQLKFKFKIMALNAETDKKISFEEFKTIVQNDYIEIKKILNKVENIVNSVLNTHFDTEALKTRLSNSIKLYNEKKTTTDKQKLVTESANIESKLALKKNGKEAYKEYLKLQEEIRDYSGKFLDLLGVDNNISKVLLKTQIDLGTALSAEFASEPKKTNQPSTTTINSNPSPGVTVTTTPIKK